MRLAIKRAIRQAAAKHLEALEVQQVLRMVSKPELDEEIHRMKLLLLGERRSFGARLRESKNQ